MNNSWSDKTIYLRESRFQYHNPDYIEFLIQRVWTLVSPCKIVDFGCGRGYLAELLDPHLLPGSNYTGLDISRSLLEDARQAVHCANATTEFIQSDAHETPFSPDRFDVAICHALLMHLATPMAVLHEMRRVTKPGGIIICCEANRSAVNAALFIAEINRSEMMDLGILQRLFDRMRLTHGFDPDIGVKLPVMFQKLGLESIQARLTDCVRYVLPPITTEEQERLYNALRSDLPAGVPEDMVEAIRSRFDALGLSQSEANQQIENERLMAKEFSRRGQQLHTVMPQMMLFCSGRVPSRNA